MATTDTPERISNPRRALDCVRNISLVEKDQWIQPVPHTCRLCLITVIIRVLKRELLEEVAMQAPKLIMNQK